MRKRNFLLPSLVAGVVGTATFFLRDEQKREQLKDVSKRSVAKWTGSTKEKEDEELNEKVGYSEPYDFEDNKMVSEGAMHSVQHSDKAEEKGEEPIRTSFQDK
ncbi:hypothetical protein D7Z54_22930 [Salibacterium salarium]|uniref:Uncharacterized protein n=1 Tax=Salibacterium salarium TaxID=284579 RepID=A0A3R9RAJ5_9BACI|nr:hypothetical protein [Salibacterium salarium]RSL31004.1 hypothetical protein D7Z54_22930 [Salibacterium salarium]